MLRIASPAWTAKVSTLRLTYLIIRSQKAKLRLVAA